MPRWLALRHAPVFAWAALLAWGGHKLVGQDTYLTLLCGREIAQHGLPHSDSLTYVTLGVPWIDQQWGAQWLFYQVARLGGLHGALLLHITLLCAALLVANRFAAARASAFSVLLGGLVMIGLASANTAARAQSFSQLAFALVIALLAADVERPSRRVHLVWPLLVLWANLHGAILLGAALVGARGALQLLGMGEPRDVRRGLLVGALATLSPMASVYGPRVLAYYRDLLTFPGREVITEWAAPSLEREPVFFAMAPLLLIVALLARKRATPFALLVFGLLGLASASSSRNIVWLGLAAAALLPQLLDQAFASFASRGDGPPYRALGPLMLALSVLGLGRLLTSPTAQLEADFPNDALVTLSRLPPDARVVTSDTLADWLMWERPELVGRVAFDVRFEVLGAARARQMRRFLYVKDDWRTSYPDATTVVVSSRHAELASALRAAGEKVDYASDDVTVFNR